MKYIKLVIEIDGKYQENLISEMLDMDFDAFEQQDSRIITYITKERFSVGYRERIEQLLSAYPGDGYIVSEEVVADQNWNEQWEQTIQAQIIGEFFVKPTWSREEAPPGKIMLEIDPKMSFGTGYHETTRLMLELLPPAVTDDSEVLDAGTGTGILAIAAVKLGAGRVFAFDIDDWSITNATENVLLNDVAGSITVEKGSVETIPSDRTMDLVLANIDRNTILDLLPDFTRILKKGGIVLLSGLLKKDEQTVVNRLRNDYEDIQIYHENEWIAIRARKES